MPKFEQEQCQWDWIKKESGLKKTISLTNKFNWYKYEFTHMCTGGILVVRQNLVDLSKNFNG